MSPIIASIQPRRACAAAGPIQSTVTKPTAQSGRVYPRLRSAFPHAESDQTTCRDLSFFGSFFGLNRRSKIIFLAGKTKVFPVHLALCARAGCGRLSRNTRGVLQGLVFRSRFVSLADLIDKILMSGKGGRANQSSRDLGKSAGGVQ